MNSRKTRVAFFAVLMLTPGIGFSEGTQQIGANHNLYDTTKMGVDILKAGEVINISVGNDTNSTATIKVTVKDPTGTEVSGSPFTVTRYGTGYLSKPGYLPPATITKPLKVVTKRPAPTACSSPRPWAGWTPSISP